MTHVLRYLLIYGERKKKVELAVDLNVENVEVETLRERAKELFNLPGVILQIWDKGFDDWVDLDDGDSTPTNSRIKVEVDKSLGVGKVLPQMMMLHPRMVDSRGSHRETPDIIHIVESPLSIAQASHVSPAQPKATSQKILHVEKTAVQHQALSSGHLSTVTRMPRDIVLAQGFQDLDKHSTGSPRTPQSHLKPSTQPLYPTSLQGSTGIPHQDYLAETEGSQQWRTLLKESQQEGTRSNATDRRHHSFGGENSRYRPTTSYYHEVLGSDTQVVDEGRVIGEGGDDDGEGVGHKGDRDRQWIFKYQLPEFPGDIAKKLKIGLDLNCTEQRAMMSAIYDSVTKYTFYPTTSDYNILTDRILQEFPKLRTQILKGNETAWESWKQKIMHKFKNQRKRRDADNPEVRMRKKQYQGRPTMLLSIGSCMADASFEDTQGSQELEEIETVVIKDEDVSQQDDDCLLNKFHVMAADTTETSNQTL